MSNNLQGFLAALLATIIWGGNFVAARALAFSIPPCQFNFWRWLLAFLVILPFATPKIRTEWTAVKNRIGYLAIMGLLGVTLMNVFVYKAGQTTASLNMALIMPATPVVVLIMARFFYGEPISLRRLMGMCMAIVGIVTLISRGDWKVIASLAVKPGDLWTLASMLCFASYTLLMRLRPHNISAAVFNAAVFGLGLVFALPMTGLEMVMLPLPTFSWPLVAGVLYAGLGCSALAFWLWTVGVDRIGPVRAGIIYYSLPLFAAIMGFFVLDERISSFQLGGGLLIICGIFIATIPAAHKKGESANSPR